MSEQDNADVQVETSEIGALLTEKSYARSYFDDLTHYFPWNPDDLYRKGQNYRIYEAMLLDDQVATCQQIRKDIILASGWSIVPQSDDQNDMAKEIDVCLREDVAVPLEESMEEMLSSSDYGFSLSEKTFKWGRDGRLTLNAIKTRHPGSWMMYQDDKGNVTRYTQRGVTVGDRGGSIEVEVPAQNLIHMVNAGRFQNPYGRSDLRAAHNAWFIKTQLVKFYAIFCEKAASPTPVAKYDKNATQEAKNKVFDALRRLQTSTAMLVPEGFEIEFLECKTSGEVYQKAINLFNMFIGRALMIPDLLGFQGSETGGGSYSLGTEQIGIFYRHISRRRRSLEGHINRHIVWPIVLANYGFVDSYPKFQLNPVSQKEMVESFELFTKAVGAGAVKPRPEDMAHLRKIINFPEVSPEEIEEQLAEERELEDPEIEKGEMDGRASDQEPESKGEQDPIVKEGKEDYAALPGEYSKKMNVEAIRASLDNSEHTLLGKLQPIVDEAYAGVANWLREKKIVEKIRVSRLSKIPVKGKVAIERAFKAAIVAQHEQAMEIALAEIRTGGKKTFAKPPLSDEFLKALEAETFQYIGDWEYKITKSARVAMLEAIKNGRPIEEAIDLFQASGKKDSLESLQRYARTKFTEVMNAGRQAAFEESGIVAGYQYSAILDKRTSDVCARLHGKTFKKGTEPRPPLHWNCRSLLVPITIYEEFKPDAKVGNKPIGQYIDENKGKGFVVEE